MQPRHPCIDNVQRVAYLAVAAHGCSRDAGAAVPAGWWYPAPVLLQTSCAGQLLLQQHQYVLPAALPRHLL